jgi:hypothetical protein
LCANLSNNASIGQFFANSMASSMSDSISCDGLLGGQSFVLASNATKTFEELKAFVVTHDVMLLIYVMDGRNPILDHALSGKFWL